MFVFTYICSAVWMDFLYYKISNYIILWGLLSFLFLKIFISPDVYLLESLVGIVLPFLFLFPIYIIGGIGAGDIKLLCVIGLILGGESSFRLTIISFVVAGMLGLIKMAYCLMNNNGKLINYRGKTKFHFSYAVLIGSVIEYTLQGW